MKFLSHFSFLLFVVVVIFISLVGVANGSVSCTAQYQCMSVSDNYNYVTCLDNTCQCLTSNGFTGSGNYTDKCRCDSPRNVYYSENTPYCVSYPQCALAEASEDRTTILKNKVLQVYNNLIYPTATKVLAGEVSVADLFSPNSRGRVDPLGTFDNYATLVEYFYVLASTPGSRVTAIDIIDLVGSGSEVFVRVNIFNEFLDSTTPASNLTQSGRYLFDDNDLIISTDLIIHNLGKASNPPAAGQIFVVENVCQTLVQTCPPAMDPTGYYTDYNDCANFMTNSIPFGTFDQAASNSVVCRFIHTLLTEFDPVTHCPHAGKTGGGKCIDVPYADYYLVNY